MKGIRRIERETLEKLADRGIKLRTYRRPKVVLAGGRGTRRILPAHSETEWFKEYVKDCIENKGMNPEEIEELAREAYGLLRYKQTLTGSSDGSQLGALFATSHVPTENARAAYRAALEEYDTKAA